MGLKKLVAIFYLLATLLTAAAQQSVPKIANRERQNSMGVEVSIYLFDSEPYERLILPAYRTFLETSDTQPLVNILESVLPEIRAGVRKSNWPVGVYEEEIAVLRGEKVYSATGYKVEMSAMRIFVETQVAPNLMQLLCLPQQTGINPEQSMSRTALDNYLYAHSQWIENYFTGVKEVSGSHPEITIGEWSRFFSKDEVESFYKELSKMAQPTNRQVHADGFENLLLLVRAAKRNPRFKLLYVIL